MNRRTLSVITLCTATLLATAMMPDIKAESSGKPGATASSAAAFQNAVKMYTAQQYGPALAAFQKILQQEPHDLAVGLYLANCYYALRQTSSARQYYRWISSASPNSPEGRTAAQMLQRMGSGTAASTSNTTGSSAIGSDLAGNPEKISDAPVDVKSMIQIIRPLGDHPACSADFINQINSALSNFPKPLLRFMYDKGCRICLTPSLVDRNPELRNTKPRGYEMGHTYKNTPAMFDSPYVVVCQYAAIGEGDDELQPMKDFLGALRHEFGHAVDHFMGYLSYTEKFRHIYYLDRGRMDDSAKNELSYYIQAGTESGGPSECFAQACCIVLGGDEPNSWADKSNKTFEQSFPGVISYVRDAVKDLNK
jgi:tetratricopeptide (TPR) repeat protein